MVVERFMKKRRVDKVSAEGKKRKRGSIVWKRSQFLWVSV